MSKIMLLRGLPGSGKSTFANAWVAGSPETSMRSNRDDLRKSVFGQDGVLSTDQENIITRIQRDSVLAGVQNNLDIVIDDTNLRLKYAREWANFALKHGADFEVIDFNVSLETCLANNAKRERKVPEDVIRNMAKRFVFPLPEVKADTKVAKNWIPYVPDITKPPVVLVDIDGTIAKANGRGFFEYDKVANDTPIEAIIDLVRILSERYQIIFMSGRADSCRDLTSDWLADLVLDWVMPEDIKLFMRSTGDYRSDDIVKHELFNNHIRNNYNVKFVLDDRNRVIDMWRAIGLTALQCAPGDF